jgi:FtsH-binding integral membrane protein
MANSSIYNNLFGSLKGGNKNTFNHLITTMYKKKEFLILVFSNLLVQLGITYYVMQRTNTSVNNWVLFAAQLILIIIISFVPMPPFIKFLLFCIFSYTFGLSLSIIKKTTNSQMINVAIQGALSVFLLMVLSGVALIFGGIRLGFQFGMILFWLLLLLIIAQLVFILNTGLSYASKIVSFLGVILFASYIVYDTNIILQRDYYGDFITASMDYYLDILNLFTSILGSNNS